MKLPEILLALALALASILLYFFRPELGDTRRWILALVAVGFFFAPLSERPLNIAWWLSALAAVCWGASLLTRGTGGVGLWATCSIAGALLTVRGGSRAAHYYLPKAGSGTGDTVPSVRRELFVSVGLFLVAFVGDGWAWATRMAVLRGAVLFVSAVFFMRYLLRQSGFPAPLSQAPLEPLAPDPSRSLVPSQRWPLLVLLTLSGATRLPDRVIEWSGSSTGALLVMSILLIVLAALLFVMSLVRLEAAGRISRSLVRRASFFGGMAVAVALAAAVVELEAWGPQRFTSFGTICTFALVVVPFVHSTTGVFGTDERYTFLIPPAILAVMLTPMTAINGDRWSLASTGFLLAFAILMLAYFLTVTLRQRARGSLYLIASLGGVIAITISDGTAWKTSGSQWRMFWIACAFVLYALDLFDRASKVGTAARRE